MQLRMSPNGGTTSTSDDELRPIGLLERFHATRNFLGFDTCVVGAARYRQTTRLTPAILFPALRQVALAHPALCVRLKDEKSPSARFVRLREINLRDVVTFSQRDDGLEAALRDQLARGFDTEAAGLPLWRVEVLLDNTVVFAVHHMVGDGLSSTAFHLALLRALNHPNLAHDVSSTIRIPSDIEMPPPIEELTTVRPSIGTLTSLMFKHVAPQRWTFAGSAWTGRRTPASAVNALRPQVRLLKIPADVIAALRRLCRKNGATLTAVFYLLAASVLGQMPMVDRGRYQSVAAGVAISLRDCAQPPIPRTAICDAVSAHYTYPPLERDVSWSAAAKYSAVLRTQKVAARESIGMMRYLGNDYAAFMRGSLDKKRDLGFVLSNLGPMPKTDDDEGGWRIENVVFAQCDVVVGAAFKMNVVGDTDGGVNCAFTWGEESVEDGFVDEVVRRFQDALRTLVL
uniref:Alcohol acetyltransferase n=1 Tax=Mycena chlorophos TaxID=658473 RepID=A0ABQ0L5I7_MYCCL|nr:predicted protein [Mycena chlorophos]